MPGAVPAQQLCSERSIRWLSASVLTIRARTKPRCARDRGSAPVAWRYPARRVVLIEIAQIDVAARLVAHADAARHPSAADVPDVDLVQPVVRAQGADGAREVHLSLRPRRGPVHQSPGPNRSGDARRSTARPRWVDRARWSRGWRGPSERARDLGKASLAGEAGEAAVAASPPAGGHRWPRRRRRAPRRRAAPHRLGRGQSRAQARRRGRLLLPAPEAGRPATRGEVGVGGAGGGWGSATRIGERGAHGQTNARR